MAVEQYLRKASLIVGKNNGEAVDLSELRFSFAVRRGDIQTPNSADIRVYNIAKDTADRIVQWLPEPEFTRVIIQAGYEGNYGVIFDGEIKQVRRGRESQLDTYIDITAADGDSAYNFAVSILSIQADETGPKDAAKYVLQDMAKFGIERGYLPDFSGNPLPRGKAIYGMTKDALRNFAKNTNTSWSIQDGKVNFVPLTAYLPGDVPIISAETGMIGLPEQTQDGIRIKTLLNPSLKIGQMVQLDNASIQLQRYGLSLSARAQADFATQTNHRNLDGFYYVMVADHQGDTRGNAWFSDLICLAIDATVSPNLLQQTGVSNEVGPIKRY